MTTTTTRRTLLAFAGATAGIATVLTPSAATAAPAIQPLADAKGTGVVADYGKTKLNLGKGWGTAQSCVVFSKDRVSCYASNSEADAAVAAAAGATAPSAGAGIQSDLCANGWLCLFEHADFGGRRLIFQDEGWQSLHAYGFAYQTSSWKNNQACDDLGGLGDGVGGAIFISGCGASATSLGGWNDRAVDVGG
jgi:hypothetical protein